MGTDVGGRPERGGFGFGEKKAGGRVMVLDAYLILLGFDNNNSIRLLLSMDHDPDYGSPPDASIAIEVAIAFHAPDES
jgi:hypothetical protein